MNPTVPLLVIVTCKYGTDGMDGMGNDIYRKTNHEATHRVAFTQMKRNKAGYTAIQSRTVGQEQ